MDTKRLVIAMTLAMAVVFGWKYLVDQFYPPTPKPPATQTAATQPATQASGNPAAPAPLATTNPAATPAVEAQITSAPGALRAAQAEPSENVILGSAIDKDPNFAMAVNLSQRGAGIESVTLNTYRQVRERDDRYQFQKPYPQMTQPTSPLATRSVTIDGQTVGLDSVAWKLESKDTTSAVYSVDIVNDAGPVLRVRKRYELTPRTNDPNTPMGYEVMFAYSFENLSGRALSVQTNFNGPTTPPQELERGQDRQFVLANLKDGDPVLAHHYVEEFYKDKVTQQLIQPEHPMLWAGASGAYFAGLVLPRALDGTTSPADYIAQVSGEALNPGADATHINIAMVIQTKPLTVEPGATLTLPFELYFGPKARGILNTAYYEAAPRYFDQVIIVGGGCTICTFQWLINALVWLLQMFHSVTHDWGLAIICLVILVRLILHPITKRATINMAKMGKMGPEMERLKKKYGDNKDELNRAMMSLYKEQGFTPILGCLPMFLQMPIWIALWSSLQSTFELRQEPFLYGWTWIDDLAKPDALISWDPVKIPLLFTSVTISSLNLLPILLGVVFYFQQKFTPKPAAATKEQEQQQKMMQWMSLLFPIFLYTGPSGLNIYIFTSTSIGIIESKRIRDHIKRQEELEAKAGPKFIDNDDDQGPEPAKKKGDKKGPDAPKKKGLAGWMAEIQQKAEEMQKEAKKRKK